MILLVFCAQWGRLGQLRDARAFDLLRALSPAGLSFFFGILCCNAPGGRGLGAESYPENSLVCPVCCISMQLSAVASGQLHEAVISIMFLESGLAHCFEHGSDVSAATKTDPRCQSSEHIAQFSGEDGFQAS